MRDLALVSGAGVSSASLVTLVLRLLTSGPVPALECLPCPECPVIHEFCLSSVFLGIGIGLLLLPLLEAFWICRSVLLRRLATRLQADYFRLCPN